MSNVLDVLDALGVLPMLAVSDVLTPSRVNISLSNSANPKHVRGLGEVGKLHMCNM